MFKVINEDTRKTSLRSRLLLTLNNFRSSLSFPIVVSEQVNISWKNYLTFYSFDRSFNVSIGGRQDLTRSNATNSVIFLISYTHWDPSLRFWNNSFNEHWKVCIKATANFCGHKNKAGDCHKSITSDYFPFYDTISCIE